MTETCRSLDSLAEKMYLTKSVFTYPHCQLLQQKEVCGIGSSSSAALRRQRLKKTIEEFVMRGPDVEAKTWGASSWR